MASFPKAALQFLRQIPGDFDQFGRGGESLACLPAKQPPAFLEPPLRPFQGPARGVSPGAIASKGYAAHPGSGRCFHTVSARSLRDPQKRPPEND
jgi:hypothetical protein